MRVVLDTNTLVSAVLSPSGPPQRLVNAARDQHFELCSNPVLLSELLDVVLREKFAERFKTAGMTPLGGGVGAESLCGAAASGSLCLGRITDGVPPATLMAGRDAFGRSATDIGGCPRLDSSWRPRGGESRAPANIRKEVRQGIQPFDARFLGSGAEK